MRTTIRHFALLATIASASTAALAQDAATQVDRPEAAQTPLTAEGRPAPAGARAAHSQGMSIAAFFAHDLRRGNEAEVELGKLASEKAQNDSVKKFAQMMVEHHGQFVQQLQEVEASAAAQGAAGAPGAPARPRVGQSEPAAQLLPAGQGETRRGQGNVRNSESGTDGERRPQGAPAAGGTSQATSAAGQAPGTTAPGTPRVTAGQAIAGQPGQALGVAAAHMTGDHVPHQVAAVLDQAADTELQMTKQMLEEYQGQDFEMGYLGQQIVAHTCMLAKLQAIKNSGPEELQQLATQAEQATRSHLDMAKQLAQQLKDKDSSGAATTPRSASSSAKQPANAPEKK